MKLKFGNIKGDRMIWAIVALLAIFSFLPVYSAASNLAYTYGDGQTFSYLIKHFVHLFLGFSIIYGIHRIEFENAEGKTTFQHIANSRNIFAIGALQAARWIKSKEIGEYSFADFLNKKL